MKHKFQYSKAAVCCIPPLTISWKETMRGQCNPACSSCRKKQNQKKKQPHSSVSSSWAPAVDTGCMKRKASNNHIKEEVISCALSITLLSGRSRKKHCFLSSTFPGTGRGRGRSPVGPTQCLGMAARLGTAPIQHHGRWTVPTGKLTKLGGSHPKNGAKKKKITVAAWRNSPTQVFWAAKAKAEEWSGHHWHVSLALAHLLCTGC